LRIVPRFAALAFIAIAALIPAGSFRRLFRKFRDRHWKRPDRNPADARALVETR
jgi:hypothetical protein